MIKTDLVDMMKCGEVTNEVIAMHVVEILQDEPFGTYIIPYDDNDKYDLTDLRYKIKNAVREAFMLPSYHSAQSVIKVNNISAVYDCDSATAWKILNSNNPFNGGDKK